MREHRHADAARAVWMILGLLAIPVLSVTSTALVADIASTTDPAAALVGIPAVLGGVITGALVFRLARTLRSGVIDAWSTLLASLAPSISLVAPAPGWAPAAVAQRPRVAFVPAGVGRRGPPVVSR
ncbi:MAG: hypothetical protein R8F63_09935 [Acidimicrobiales bacterium]|nr:hypothetical protein [Acidimicrobiales bacterium]